MRKLLAVVITGTVLCAAAAAQAQLRRGGAASGSCIRMTASPAGSLAAAEVSGIAYTREEEKLARDVYLALHETWQAAIFVQIAGAEQRHMDAVGRLLDRYGIADPAQGNPVGVFTDARLSSLYADLVARGRISLPDALAVGAAIEDLDLADIERLDAATENEDLDLVYGNLARGSRNHLRAFVAQLDVAGGTYAPKYVASDVYAQIIGSPWERRAGAARHGSGSHARAGGQRGGSRNGPGDGTGSGTGNGAGPGAGSGTGACDGTGRP